MTTSRKRAASETQEEPTKKMTQKWKLASPLSQRIWSEEDELCLLKKLVDFRSNKTKRGAKIDWGAFYNFLQGSFHGKFSMEQMSSKIKKLKEKFLEDNKRIDGGKDPLFTRCSDSAIFGYASMLWGQNELQVSDDDQAQQSEIASEEALKESNVEAPNAETVNNHEAEKSNVDDKLPTEVGVGEDSHDDDDADVLCALRDAFETMMSHGLSDYQKKLQLQKLMNLDAGKRKELSKEWNALCAEEIKLNVKKIRFSIKLAEASTH